MILTGKEIQRRMGGDIKIDPFRESQLNPNSYNLRLHNVLIKYRDGGPDGVVLDMKKRNPVKTLEIGDKGFLMKPGELYLGRTIERTETHNLVPMLEGRSSIGRLGMYIHVTAGFGDIGFTGYWTLEMHVIRPLWVYAGVEIAQIFYHTIEGEAAEYNSGKYQDNLGVQASRLYKDFEDPPKS